MAAKVGRPVGVLADLPGPKIRAGSFPDGGVDIDPGEPVRLVPGTGPSSAAIVAVDYPTLLADLDPGDRIVIGDGGITMRVLAIDAAAALCEVESGGHTQGRPGVHLSCERLQMFSPTAQDLELAEVVASAGVEYVALSFVRRAADVLALREVVGGRAGIVAKIETASALGELAAITDGRRRGDGRTRRPRHRLPVGGRPAPPEAHHPPLRERRDARHHRHPDAGDDDHRAGADASRGQRRRQRGVRRDRRGDAVGRDGRR